MLPAPRADPSAASVSGFDVAAPSQPPALTRRDQPSSDHGRIDIQEPVRVRLRWTTRASTLHLELSGELCAWSVEQIQPVALDLLVTVRPARIVVDLAHVTFADARAASMLVQINRLAVLDAAELHLSAPAAPVLRVLELGGLHDAFHVRSGGASA